MTRWWRSQRRSSRSWRRSETSSAIPGIIVIIIKIIIIIIIIIILTWEPSELEVVWDEALDSTDQELRSRDRGLLDLKATLLSSVPILWNMSLRYKQ